MSSLFEMPIAVSEAALSRRWVFPFDRFAECEESDVRWASALGYGHWKYEPGMYRVGNMFVAHPVVYDRLRKVLTDA